MSDLWLPPPEANTLHCIGDLHEGAPSMTLKRKLAVLYDLNNHPRMPGAMDHLQLGDFANTAHPDEYRLGKEWMNQLQGPWHGVVGNHDMWGQPNKFDTRSAELAAADIGMPAASYTFDLGYAVLIVLGPITLSTHMSFDLEWLNTQLVANTGRTCLIAAHPPLYGTVGAGSPDTEVRSTDEGFFAYVDSEIRAVLADNPNAKAWISGHTHSQINDRDFVKRENVGGRTLAAISTSCNAFSGRTSEWFDRLSTVYVTVEDDRIEVRFRDHGAHQWMGGSHDRRRIWTVPFD